MAYGSSQCITDKCSKLEANGFTHSAADANTDALAVVNPNINTDSSSFRVSFCGAYSNAVCFTFGHTH